MLQSFDQINNYKNCQNILQSSDKWTKFASNAQKRGFYHEFTSYKYRIFCANNIEQKSYKSGSGESGGML
jgi:hypothetical protein